MNVEYHKWWSPALQQDAELKVYGHAGKPVMVFPAAGGRFFEYEDFGMVDACRSFIDEGRVRFVTVDSVDNQSWLNYGIHPRDRARRHGDYEQYIMGEVVPLIHGECCTSQKILTTGCSMGAFHALNFLFRHPDVFDGVIALSGVYEPRSLLGDYMDGEVYFNFPLVYMPNLDDPWYLDQLRNSSIVVCVGQGAWERGWDYDCVGDAHRLREILESKNIPCRIEFWGHDASHDWPWWRRQMPYFLGESLG